MMEEKDEFPIELIRKMGEYGMVGIPVPEEWGGANTTELIFENVEVPVENLLGQEGEGFKIAMAKRFSTDIAMKTATEAVQIYGGYGYTREYPVERLFQDAKVTKIYEGTNEIQRLVISKYFMQD
ncbi:alkylation response protein AidB-like acyl-CoA dehydrogenase [Neobacillus niacini]|nr:alkylation response protein AidB-like acyl-CoA dehydrogenase [Neobacillus niacini]